MTAVDEIRAEQKWPDDYIAKTLRELLTVLMRKLAAKINKKAARARGALSLIRKSAVNQNIMAGETLTPYNICCNRFN